jgi:hypothetical protein
LQVDYNEATGAAKLEPEEPAPKPLTLTDIEIEDEQRKMAAKK